MSEEKETETISIEIYFRDLDPEKQAEIETLWKTTEHLENWDTIPITVIEREVEIENR